MAGYTPRTYEERRSMSNFEKITASLETLGDFLASLMAVDTPWEDAFHKTFCTECGRDNCDEKHCPFQKERDNPTWWLYQTAEGEQEAANDSEREFLIREYERRLARLKNGASPCGVIFRNGRTELEPGKIEALQEEPHANGGFVIPHSDFPLPIDYRRRGNAAGTRIAEENGKIKEAIYSNGEKGIPRRIPAGDGAAAGCAGVWDGKGPGA